MPKSAPCIIHPNVTVDRVLGNAEEDDYTGICLYCGEETTGVEPDAERYPCPSCDQPYVYGAEQILLLGYYHDDD